eukprot:g153.t1
MESCYSSFVLIPCLALLVSLLSTTEAHSNDTNLIWSVLDGGGRTIDTHESSSNTSPSSAPAECEYVQCNSQRACKDYGCRDDQCAKFPKELEDDDESHNCIAQKKSINSTSTQTTMRNETNTTTTTTQSTQSSSSTTTTTTSSYTSRWEEAFSGLWSSGSNRLLLTEQSSSKEEREVQDANAKDIGEMSVVFRRRNNNGRKLK